MAAKRRIKTGSQQKSVSLPVPFWALLDEVADLQTDAFHVGKGRGVFTLSDLVEFGIEMYLKDLISDLGPLPKTPEERRDYVLRLADYNHRMTAKRLEAEALAVKSPDDSH